MMVATDGVPVNCGSNGDCAASDGGYVGAVVAAVDG